MKAYLKGLKGAELPTHREGDDPDRKEVDHRHGDGRDHGHAPHHREGQLVGLGPTGLNSPQAPHGSARPRLARGPLGQPQAHQQLLKGFQGTLGLRVGSLSVMHGDEMNTYEDINILLYIY